MQDYEKMTRYEKLGMHILWLSTAIEDEETPDEWTIKALGELGIAWTGNTKEAYDAVRAARKVEKANA